MAEVKKIPYYTMKRSIFRGKVWKENDGLEGLSPSILRKKSPIIVARLVK